MNIKHIAWILKLKRNYISYKRNKERKGLPFTNLNIKDIDCAGNEILKHCQLECFENEFADLAKLLPLKSGKLNSSKCQVIISNNHPISFLLAFRIHVANFHSVRDLTLNFT